MLSRVVAPWNVSDPGVVVEPIVLLDELPEPKVFVVFIPVARVVSPDEVIVVDELFGIVTVPVPNVTGLFVVVLMERVVADVRSIIGFKDEMLVEALFKVSNPVPVVNVLLPDISVFPLRRTAPVPVVNVLLPVILVFPLSEMVPVPVEKVPLPDWMKLELFSTVTVPLDVIPEVAVINPEMVGVVVQLVPVTVKSPPNVVSPVPTLKVLDPDTSVFPFRVFAPVPVEKVPVPLWVKLLLVVSVTLPLREMAPVPVESVYDPT